MGAWEAMGRVFAFKFLGKKKAGDGSVWLYDTSERALNRRATSWLHLKEPAPAGNITPPLQLVGTVVYLSPPEHHMYWGGALRSDPAVWPKVSLNPALEIGPTWEDLRGVRDTW